MSGSLQSSSEEEPADEASLSHHLHAAGQSDFDDEESHHHHHRPSRRRRSFYTRCQLAFLEDAFSSGGHYPDQLQREQLARALGVTEARVQVCRSSWFSCDCCNDPQISKTVIPPPQQT